MKILISGASGLVGSLLGKRLEAAGHTVVALSRAPTGSGVVWDPAAGQLDPTALTGLDAAIHLAGENLAAGRWTVARKEKFRASRVNGTRLLSTTLAQLDHPPKVLVCASAIGYYGDRGNESLNEASPPGHGFLADMCAVWEAAADPAATADIRVVHLRLGLVLSASGGALAKMRLPFSLGLGGRLGNGRQYMSWISLEDTVRAFCHALEDETISGPLNCTAPLPVTNAEFTRCLGSILRRPTVFPVPAFALKILFGKMARPLMLEGSRVYPEKLLAAGFHFEHETLEPALRWALAH
jgi:uncharacterized protein (TIGR01777 family)